MFSKNKILYSIKFLLLATLLSPLIVDVGVIFPFVFTKVIYFRSLIDLAVILYLILVYKHREYLPRNNFLVMSGFLFLFLTIIISYFGVDWNFSFFNGHERMDGIFSLIHYFIFAVLLMTIFEEKDWRIFLRFLFVVSFLVGVYIFVLVYIFVAKNKQIKLSLVALMVISLAFIFAGIFFPNNKIIKNIPIVNNLSDIKNLGGSVSNRVLVSQVAIGAFKEKPLGWGFNNFSTAFNSNYKAEFLRRGWGDTFFDYAHNYYLDILVGLGVLGFGSFLAIFASAIYKVIKKIKKSRRKIFFSLFLSLMTQLLFSFLHPTFYLWLFLSLAFIAYMTKDTEEDGVISSKKFLVVNVFILLFAIFFSWALFYGNIKVYTANRLDENVRFLIHEKHITEALLLIENSLGSLGPMHREIVRDYAEYLVAASITTEQKERYVELLFSLNTEILKNLEKYNQSNMFDYLFLMRVNIILNTLGEDKGAEIENIFARASNISDEKQELNFLYFNYLVQSEKIDEARVLMEKIVKDDTQLYYGYWYLARIHLFLGDINTARDYYQQAIDRGFVPSEGDTKIIDFILESYNSKVLNLE